MFVHVPVDLHAEELGGEELPVLGVPRGDADHGGIGGEGTAGVLVHADRDAELVLPVPDGVGGLPQRGRGGGAPVVDVHVGDTRQPQEIDAGIRHPDRVAAAERELDIGPFDTGIGQGQVHGVGSHFHGRLVAEPPEGVEADTDDRNVVHADTPRCVGSMRLMWREPEGQDLGTILVDEERDHHELDLGAETELGRVVLGEPRLDAHFVAELDEADAERREGRASGERLLGRELLCRPAHQRPPAGKQALRHVGTAAARAVRLPREGHRAA